MGMHKAKLNIYHMKELVKTDVMILNLLWHPGM